MTTKQTLADLIYEANHEAAQAVRHLTKLQKLEEQLNRLGEPNTHRLIAVSRAIKPLKQKNIGYDS